MDRAVAGLLERSVPAEGHLRSCRETSIPQVIAETTGELRPAA